MIWVVLTVVEALVSPSTAWTWSLYLSQTRMPLSGPWSVTQLGDRRKTEKLFTEKSAPGCVAPQGRFLAVTRLDQAAQISWDHVEQQEAEKAPKAKTLSDPETPADEAMTSYCRQTRRTGVVKIAERPP